MSQNLTEQLDLINKSITAYAIYHSDDMECPSALPIMVFFSLDDRDINKKLTGNAKEDFIKEVAVVNLEEGQRLDSIIYPGVFVNPITHEIIQSPEHKVVISNEIPDIKPLQELEDLISDGSWADTNDTEIIVREDLTEGMIYEIEDCTTVFIRRKFGLEDSSNYTDEEEAENWHCGTTRNSWDAFRLKDYGISYGTYFKETMRELEHEIDYKSLDPNKMYTITFSNPKLHLFSKQHSAISWSKGLTLDRPVVPNYYDEHKSYCQLNDGVLTMYMSENLSEMRYDCYNNRHQYSFGNKDKGSYHDLLTYHIVGLLGRVDMSTDPERKVRNISMFNFMSEQVQDIIESIYRVLEQLYKTHDGKKSSGNDRCHVVFHKKSGSLLEFKKKVLKDKFPVLKFITKKTIQHNKKN